MENLKNKDFRPDSLVKMAIEDLKTLSNLLNNIHVKDDLIRYNSHKVLLLVSESNPEVLYSYWDFFVNLLKSINNFHKVIGIQILANLSKVDIDNKFELIFNLYCGLLDASSVMTASHLAMNLGKIAKAKANLREKITEILLSIDKTSHEESRKDLIKGSVINSFMEYFDKIKDKDKIIHFVQEQLNSSSPKTRKMADDFLKKVN